MRIWILILRQWKESLDIAKLGKIIMNILGNSNWINRFIPPVTLNIIIINFIVWFAQIVLPKYGFDVTRLMGLHFFVSESFNPIQLFTYMFLHSPESMNHLFFNMFSVWIFGSTIENTLGTKKYIFYYITCGLFAALTQEITWYLSTPSDIIYGDKYVDVGFAIMTAKEYLSELITVGASGSIFGLLLAFGMLYPNNKVYIYFLFPIKAKYFVIIYGLIELFFGISGTMDNVAHFAHLGGMLGGIILMIMWKNKGY